MGGTERFMIQCLHSELYRQTKNKHMKFLFDLDGTVTAAETLPIISEHFGCTEQIAELTARTVAGNVPFIESFIRRVNILGQYSVKETSDLLAQVPLTK